MALASSGRDDFVSRRLQFLEPRGGDAVDSVYPADQCESGKIDNPSTSNMSTLENLFVEQLSATYDAEKQLVVALPKVAAATSNSKLKTALQEHLQETKGHVLNLEKAFAALGEQPASKSCLVMQALIDEADELIAEGLPGDVLDAGLIGGCQMVEHHEIACYGTLATWAKQLGEDEVLSLLKENLAQEKAADEKLTKLAESEANSKAAGGTGRESVLEKVGDAIGLKS
jgi:ferritin-like metal-binding protein YciE